MIGSPLSSGSINHISSLYPNVMPNVDLSSSQMRDTAARFRTLLRSTAYCEIQVVRCLLCLKKSFDLRCKFHECDVSCRTTLMALSSAAQGAEAGGE